MPTEEYTSTPGGALKLKGSKISKRSHHHNKKKRPKPPPSPPPVQQPAEDEGQQQQQQRDEDGPLSKRRLVPVANNNDEKKQNEDRLEVERVEEDEGRDDALELEDGLSGAVMRTEGDKKGVWAVGKTEAERRHEEQRRKRVSFFFFFNLSFPQTPERNEKEKEKKSPPSSQWETLERLIRPANFFWFVFVARWKT